MATCIGCGAMSRPGRCAGCCSDERRLELVPAARDDEVRRQIAEDVGDVDRLCGVLRRFIGRDGDVESRNWEAMASRARRSWLVPIAYRS